MLLETVPSLRAEHPRTKVVFAGDGDMRAGLEDRARRVGSNGTTRFVGYQTGQPLIDLFKSSDVVCVPSRNEPFGIVILEAWSAPNRSWRHEQAVRRSLSPKTRPGSSST